MTFPINKFTVFLVVIVATMLACGQSGSAPDATLQPAASAAPIDNAAPVEIQQQNSPGELPAERMSKIGDYDSSLHGKTAPDGDRFSRGEYERPFNANTMDTYFPYLDIQNALVFQDETWIFGVIDVKTPDGNNTLPGNYALQFDTNIDGRGDWLALASNPASTNWTTTGVQIWQDGNGDVGGVAPISADEHPIAGDGFEVKVFDSGQGNESDLAWVRIAPDNASTIQIAVKRSLINDNEYLVNMWAGTGDLNPALFDFNDHMTHEQAGAADPGLELYYPIKELSELDNTCHMAIGFQPDGSEPGLCKELRPDKPGGDLPVPGQPPPPCVPGIAGNNRCP